MARIHSIIVNRKKKKFRFQIRLGDEFALREGGSLYCKDDHDVLEKSAQTRVAPIIESNNNTNLNNNNHSSELGSMSGKQHIDFFFYLPRTVSILNVVKATH